MARESAPAQQLAEGDDFTWYDGTANPEPVLDQFNQVTSFQALGALCLGFAAYATIGVCGYLYDPVSKATFIPKEFPYNNLEAEMGGLSIKK